MKIPYLVFSTIVLFASNFVVRILGFVYKIFLARIMDGATLGIYNMVFNLLMICLSITTTGIPTALSCLVANKKALKDRHSANVLFISTLYISFFVSLVICLIVSFNSRFFAKQFLEDSKFNSIILAIAPSIVIITISNVLRGYFYGIKKIKIPAVGQIIEQISKIIFVCLFVIYLKNRDLNCYIALIGISIGELCNIIFVSIYLWKEPYLSNKYIVRARDFYNTSMETIKMSIPITCNRMTSVLLQCVGSMMVPSRLVLSGITYTKALSLYGILTGMVFPFVFVPFTLSSALVVNLIPSISQEVALNKKSRVLKKIKYSLLLTLVVGVITSIFLYFFGEIICTLVFKNKLAGQYLKAMFLVPSFMSLNQTLSGILNSIRKELASSLNTIFAMILQLIALYVLLPIPKLNIYAYIYTVTGYSILVCILNGTVLLGYLKNNRNKI